MFNSIKILHLKTFILKQTDRIGIGIAALQLQWSYEAGLGYCSVNGIPERSILRHSARTGLYSHWPEEWARAARIRTLIAFMKGGRAISLPLRYRHSPRQTGRRTQLFENRFMKVFYVVQQCLFSTENFLTICFWTLPLLLSKSTSIDIHLASGLLKQKMK